MNSEKDGAENPIQPIRDCLRIPNDGIEIWRIFNRIGTKNEDLRAKGRKERRSCSATLPQNSEVRTWLRNEFQPPLRPSIPQDNPNFSGWYWVDTGNRWTGHKLTARRTLRLSSSQLPRALHTRSGAQFLDARR